MTAAVSKALGHHQGRARHAIAQGAQAPVTFSERPEQAGQLEAGPQLHADTVTSDSQCVAALFSPGSESGRERPP